MTITLSFGKDFGIGLDDRTIIILDPSEVSDNINCESDEEFHRDVVYGKYHPDGWTIKAKLEADYYVSIEEFEADHPIYGKIKGRLDDKIVADSLEGWKHFSNYHPLREFDCGDI